METPGSGVRFGVLLVCIGTLSSAVGMHLIRLGETRSSVKLTLLGTTFRRNVSRSTITKEFW